MDRKTRKEVNEMVSGSRDLHTIDIETFKALQKEGLTRKQGKCNWTHVLQQLRQLTVAFDVEYVYRNIVKGAVSRYRTKRKLDEFADKNLLVKIYDGFKMWYIAPEQLTPPTPPSK